MQATSTWALAPELSEALARGTTTREWIGDRRPVCSYARISEEKQQAAGVARQHLNNTAAAVPLGLAVVAHYTDNHLTAADPAVSRPGFLQMVRDLRARQTAEGVPVSGIVAVAADRVYRLPSDRLRVHRALTVNDDGCFYAVDEHRFVELHRTATDGDAWDGEVTAVRQRTARSVRDRAREGKQSGGHRRFGWLPGDRRQDRPHNHELDPVESACLRKMIGMLLSGESSESVSAWLNNEGVPTVRGGRWTGNTVRNIVSNPAICGYRMLDGELVTDLATGAPVVGSWAAAATVDEWRRLAALYPGHYRINAGTLKGDPARSVKRRKSPDPESARKYLLSGIVRCGKPDEHGRLCDSKMVGNPPSRPTGRPSYACKLPSCRGVARQVALVDEAVEGYVISALTERYGAEQPSTPSWHGQGVLDSLRERAALLKRQYAHGGIAPHDFFDVLSELNAHIAESEKDGADFTAQQATANAFAGFSRDRWQTFGLAQKRKAISAVVQAVVVRPLPKGRARHAPFDPSLLEFVPPRVN
ncbi:recombinase family protein [Streptomyces beijiangensis]|uniref:Recombinase family protein n=1 Tax=Streptomyces beijiangensis TaxID=163361 RepID=A0A939F544_9ACTN|nr:recombinase family protein [Streptomyces beijiangensis]MBO0510555.1 recombinase family protein [Streptomyces beijiangensis]